MITDKEFIKEENEEEISSVVESFLNRAKERNLFKISKEDEEIGEVIIRDKHKADIIKEMIKDFKEYKN